MSEKTEPEASEAGNELQERMNQLREEAEMLKKMQEDLERQQEDVKEDKEEVDGRSVYVGNVEYAATPRDLEKLFNTCGNINRVNIMVDKFGNPKGFAYIEFAEPSMVASALTLNESEFFGRQIKVLPKRTNIHGYNSRGRGRGRGGYRSRGGYRGRGGYRPY